MSMKIQRSPSLGGGPRSLSRTQGILLETMQLVEPRKPVPVPNHLLGSKVYSKIAGNSVVQARPAVIHFSGFELGVTQTMLLHLGNVSTEVQRMHIIPPQTKFFNIKYKKNDRLVPGLTLDCTVEFTADEWRYYYDCIRIHCKGEENLIIPIHAYPIMGSDEFPKRLDFSPVPVGQKSERIIPLRCNAPIDFEFKLSYLQPHPAFSVEPMAGLVPAQGEVDIAVTFAPTEFSTAHMKLQLVISQFNSKPFVCSITGSSLPGLAKQMAEDTFSYDDGMLLDPRSITPVERARSKKSRVSKKEPAKSLHKPQEIEKDGIRFPSNMDTPFAVGQVLNQEPGKLRIRDIREAVLAKKGEVEASTRQMKEAMFDMAVRKNVYEERQNQLRWQSKIGDDQITLEQKHEILEARELAWRDYKLERGDPVPEKEALRKCTECTFRRTIRDSSCVGQEGVKFDTYTNDLWAARYHRLSRFQQAARTIIIRRRADKKLKGLRQMLLDWSKKKFNPAATPGGSDEEDEDLPEEDVEAGTIIQVERVTSVTFPTYVEPNVKDDMAVDALGAVPYMPTEVNVPKKTPYFNLKVPQHYHLMGYAPHNVHEAATSYVPPNLVKTLRTGAEDEIITLPPPALREPPPGEEGVNEGDLKVEEVEGSCTPEPISLKPPQALFRPIEYPPLHIFNPAPGLQVFQAPLPYSEVDPDFHLCPLPRYTAPASSGPHSATQKNYLDKEDVIRGVMAWKKIPSQGLTSLSNTPTLTNVWVPRWSDPFVSDLLPETIPPLLGGLLPQDKDNIMEEDEEETGVTLTPEMVNAQFTLIDRTAPPEEKPKQKDAAEDAIPVKSHHHGQHRNKEQEEKATKSVEPFPHGNKLPTTNVPVSHHGPVPREQREVELDHFMKKKYNRLGAKINQRVHQLNTIKTNADLVLK